MADGREERPVPGGILEESIATRTDRESGEGISGYLDGRPVDACLEGADSLTWLVERVARGALQCRAPRYGNTGLFKA